MKLSTAGLLLLLTAASMTLFVTIGPHALSMTPFNSAEVAGPN